MNRTSYMGFGRDLGVYLTGSQSGIYNPNAQLDLTLTNTANNQTQPFANSPLPMQNLESSDGHSFSFGGSAIWPDAFSTNDAPSPGHYLFWAKVVNSDSSPVASTSFDITIQ